MDSFLPLTLLAGLIGVYTVLPEYKKVRIRYSFGKMEFLMLSILVIVLIFSLIVSSYISDNLISSNIALYQIMNLPISNNLSPSIIYLLETPLNYQFLIDIINIMSIIVIFLIFCDKFFTNKIKIKDKNYFIYILDELFYKHEYNAVISLIKDNYNNVIKFEEPPEVYEKILIDSITSVIKLRKPIKSNQRSSINKFLDNLRILMKKDTYKYIFDIFKKKFTNINNKIFEPNEYLQSNIETRLLDVNHIQKIVEYNPYFGLKIVTDRKIDPCFREDFANLYFKELMRDKNSILYREIKNTTSLVYRYKISKYNELIYELLFNIDIADKLNLYKPLGDLTLELLDQLRKDNKDVYNGYNSDLILDSDERYNDPLFMIIHFFDIVIRESIYQNIDSQMWLYYYENFVKEIALNYKLNEHSKPEYEFPSVYSSLLFEMFHNIISWIDLIRRDTDNIQKALANVSTGDEEHEDIIKTYINCLCSCLQHVIKPTEFSKEFKIYLIDMVFNLYFKLILNDKMLVNEYGKLLEDCLLETASLGNEYKDILIHVIELDKSKLYGKKGGYAKLKVILAKLNAI